jgi:hypothetical protein
MSEHDAPKSVTDHLSFLSTSTSTSHSKRVKAGIAAAREKAIVDSRRDSAQRRVSKLHASLMLAAELQNTLPVAAGVKASDLLDALMVEISTAMLAAEQQAQS